MEKYAILYILGFFVCVLDGCHREVKTQTSLTPTSIESEQKDVRGKDNLSLIQAEENRSLSLESEGNIPSPTPAPSPIVSMAPTTPPREIASSSYESPTMPKTEAPALAVSVSPSPMPSVAPDKTSSSPSRMEPAKVWKEPEKKYVRDLVQQFETRIETPRKPEGWEWVGKKLPVSRFIQEGGEILDLQDYEGKQNVLLVILRGFAGSICAVCSSQTFALSKNIHRFHEKETQVIVVYPGRAETVPHFLESLANLDPDFKPPFPMVMDVELSFIHRFQLEGKLAKPTSILIDKKGLVKYAYVGKNAMDRPSIPVLLREIDKINGQP